MLLRYCDPTTRVANIVQFCQFWFADMPWVGHCSAAVFASIGPLDLLGTTEMAFFCSHQSAGLTLVNSWLRFLYHICYPPSLSFLGYISLSKLILSSCRTGQWPSIALLSSGYIGMGLFTMTLTFFSDFSDRLIVILSLDLNFFVTSSKTFKWVTLW